MKSKYENVLYHPAAAASDDLFFRNYFGDPSTGKKLRRVFDVMAACRGDAACMSSVVRAQQAAR